MAEWTAKNPYKHKNEPEEIRCHACIFEEGRRTQAETLVEWLDEECKNDLHHQPTKIWLHRECPFCWQELRKITRLD